MIIKGVIFDLYGTLFEYGDLDKGMEAWLKQFHSCLGTRGLSITLESFIDYYNRNIAGLEFNALGGQLTLFEQRIQRVCADFGLAVNKVDIKQTGLDLLKVWDGLVSLDPDCITVLEKLKQKQKIMGLISNFDHPPHIYALLEKSGLNQYLSTVVISGELGIKKPDTRIFDAALEETGLQPRETIFVGDSEEDMVGANLSGMISVLIDRNQLGKRYGQYHTIKSLLDILNLI